MNSVTKAKRGYVPEDERNFSPSAMKVLRTASGHVEYLINEGYDLKQAVTKRVNTDFESGNKKYKRKWERVCLTKLSVLEH